MQDGRYFDSGVPNGFPDLAGFRLSDGKAIYLEVKTEKGKLRKEQIHFLNEMNKYPVIASVVRSADEAVKIVMEG